MTANIKSLLIFSLIILSNILVGQDFKSIDTYAKTAPYVECKNPETLAQYLNKKANADIEKIRAYYVWLSHNIKYDTKAFFSGKLKKASANETLKQRKAVCQGYSELFKALCDYSNIPCYIVSGYSKGYGFNPNRRITNADHAWNIVKINNKWQLIDATWGAGHVDEKQRFNQNFTEDFFLTNPKEFILKHLPSDPMWQLLSCPIEVEDFRKSNTEIQSILSKNKKVCFSFNDTIAHFETLSAIDKKVNSAERAYRFNPSNFEVPGFAYLNMAYEVSQDIPQLYEEKNYKEALDLNRKVLKINERAYYFLRKSKSDQSKNAANISKQNIAQLKTAIKSLEEFVD